MKKRALIIGIHGQDGSYMAELLEKKDYEVYGIIKPTNFFSSQNEINNYQVNITSPTQIKNILDFISPDEIYNFAAVSNVFRPFENTEQIINVNLLAPALVMDYIYKFNKKIKFFQSSSRLVFEGNGAVVQNEQSIRKPLSPYAIIKNAVDQLVEQYRTQYDLYCCSGIFFNHESPLRGAHFFTKKITTAAALIKLGKQKEVFVSPYKSVRDYGYAPDYMEAAFLMMQNHNPEDFVISTGEATSTEDFIKKAFNYVGLNYKDYVKKDESLNRDNDSQRMVGDSRNIRNKLGWIPLVKINELVKIMMDAALIEQTKHTV